MRLPPPRSISIMPVFRPGDRADCGGVCCGEGSFTTTLGGKGEVTATWTGIRRGTTGIANPSARASFRQVKSNPRETPCLRATSETFAPDLKLSSVIRAFSSSDQRRRRSTPSKISTRTGVYPTLSTSLRSYLRRSTKTNKAVKIGCIQYNRLSEEYESADELPDEIDQRFGEIEAAMEELDNRPVH